MTWLLIPVIFYGVIAPFGVVFRRGRRDSMRRFFEPEATSDWSLREPGKTASKSRKSQY